MHKNRFFLFFLFLCFSVLFTSCYYNNEEELYGITECDTISVSFSADIVPILEIHCYECHSIENADDKGDSYILETYEELDASTNGEDLINVVDWISGGPANMPKDKDQLPDCERSLIRSWVNQGMLDN